MKQNIRKSGFTILEMLVALAISSIIIIGYYFLISSVTASNEKLSDINLENKIYAKLHELLLFDIVSSDENKISVNEFGEDKEYSIKTHHSLIYQSAFTITVVYTVEDNKLVRKEINNKLGIDKKLVILDNVSRFEILSFNGNEYSDTDLNTKLLKIVLTSKNKNYEFIIGKL